MTSSDKMVLLCQRAVLYAVDERELREIVSLIDAVRRTNRITADERRRINPMIKFKWQQLEKLPPRERK
jgi:hypothetical protein